MVYFDSTMIDDNVVSNISVFKNDFMVFDILFAYFCVQE